MKSASKELAKVIPAVESSEVAAKASKYAQEAKDWVGE